MPEPLILADPDIALPEGQDYWTTPAMVDEERLWPTFTPHEVARCFFGRSTPWLRKWIRLERHIFSDGKVEPPRKPSDAHAYRLYDIERLACAFAENGVITTAHLEQVLTIVKASARMHGFLK